MNEEIIDRLYKVFDDIGDEHISGHLALKIIKEIIEDFELPSNVKEAQQYIANCQSDMGFMGSPEYDLKNKIVQSYFEQKKEKECNEISKYFILKAKYGVKNKN